MIRVTFNSRISDEVEAAVFGAIQDATEFMLDECNKGVPHNEGTLEASGLPSYDRAKLQGAVSYNTPYAVRLHEHPEFRFQKGRRGKWVERAFSENRGALQTALDNRLSTLFRS